MFLIGFNSYGSQPFDNKIGMETPTKLTLSSGKYDEWKLDTGIVDYSDSKTIWEHYTLFLATFNNTLEAGNMANNGYEITDVYFKRRRKSNLLWTTFAKMKYNPNQKFYQVLDRFAKSGDEFEYAIVPVSSGVEGVETIKSIVHTFDNLWVMGKDDGVRLVYNIEYSDINTIGNQSIITTLANRFPYISSTPLCYQQGTVKARLISETSFANREVNVRSERELRERTLRFLNDGKAKMIKDGSGRCIVARIANVRETPDNIFGGDMCDISFDFIEICDPEDSKGLEDVGLLVKNY